MPEKKPDEILEKKEIAPGGEDQPAEPKTGFALRVEKMSEREWDKWSIVAGAVLGILSAGFLFLYPASEGSPLPMGSLIALALAMIVPGYAERRLERRAPKLRIALIVTLVVAIAAYLIVMLLTNGGEVL